MLNRRGFLGKVGSVAAAGALASTVSAAESYPNDFHVGGYHVKWGGWREPANQAIVFGYWFAFRPNDDLLWASSSLGTCTRFREFDVIPSWKKRDWPTITVLSSEADREVVKRRALMQLLVCLKTGE